MQRAAAAGDRARARHRDRRRLPARRRVRPRRRGDRRALRDVGHQLRPLLRDARRAGVAQRLAQARVRDAVDRRVHRRARPRSTGASSIASCPRRARRRGRARSRGDRSRSRAPCVAAGKALFYEQLEEPLAQAYAAASKAITRNMLGERRGRGRRRVRREAQAALGRLTRRQQPRALRIANAVRAPACRIIAARLLSRRNGAPRACRRGMADDTILETRRLTKEFKGFVAVKDVSLSHPQGHHPRADRPERRRQDHLLQPAHAFPDADARPDLLQGARDHRLAAGGDRADGARPLVPDLRRVSESHRARERAHRAAAASAATRSISGAPRRSSRRTTSARWS